MAQRQEYMYNYLDWDNDRVRVRNRFIKDREKRTTLKEIGQLLDEFILDNKATYSQFYDPFTEDTVTSATKD